jgi:asparagine synthase (glutamine-hydrolysing)
MCGLNGVFSFGGARVDAGDVVAMRDAMSHRGPDGAGSWMSDDGRVGLGHRRLSIIDLSSAAAQPMSNDDGSIQVVFNGEIYNHAELRRELEAASRHRWKTDHADTEVIIRAYETWGIDCVDRFRGMFAIALWDSRADRLWLVRDRICVKPLYWTMLPERIAFASEIKGLLALTEVPRSVNEEALYHYLSFLTPPAPLTMFSGIHKLPAATRMSVDGSGAIHTERYWNPWTRTTPMKQATERDVAADLLDELRTAVRYRKVSDVPVGVFLSGGIDSSVNAALFSEHGPPPTTFSIGYEGDHDGVRDELIDAREMSALLGGPHHERRLNETNALDVLDLMVYHLDEPNGDAACIPLYYLARLARDAGVNVCQVGEGSDELFCGYPFWREHMRVDDLNALPLPRFTKRLALGAFAATGRKSTYSYEVLRRAAEGEPTFWGGAEGLTDVEKQLVLGKELRARFGENTSATILEPIQREFMESAWEPSALNWMTHLDLTIRLPELLLMRVDKMTMAASVEGREPFLDHKLVEFALSVPTSMKTGDGELKHLLKLAVRGVIPDKVIERPKQGFAVPLHGWMHQELGRLMRARILRFAETTGILESRGLPEFLERATASKVWLLFNLAAWHDRFIAHAV